MKNKNKLLEKALLIIVMALPLMVNAQVCDYTASSVTFNIGTSATLPSNSLTSYLLVDNATKTILQISSTPSFTGIVQSKLYDVYAYSYVNNNTVTGLVVGGALSTITSSCGDFSNSLTVRICPASGTGSTCDYTTSSFTVKTASTPPAGGTTQYILANSSGVILQLTSTPTFTGLSGSQSYNVYAVSYTGTVSNLTVGSSINSISGSCYDLSNALPITVCVCQPICLPVTVTKIK
jgi:hypothetical protein|nr:hypothetical protein [uncultured Emticicia sp.]